MYLTPNQVVLGIALAFITLWVVSENSYKAGVAAGIMETVEWN